MTEGRARVLALFFVIAILAGTVRTLWGWVGAHLPGPPYLWLFGVLALFALLGEGCLWVWTLRRPDEQGH